MSSFSCQSSLSDRSEPGCLPSLTVGAERGERGRQGQAGPGLGRECFAYPTLFVRRLVIRTNIPLTGNSLTLSSNPALINYWKLELGNQVRNIFFTFLIDFLWNKKIVAMQCKPRFFQSEASVVWPQSSLISKTLWCRERNQLCRRAGRGRGRGDWTNIFVGLFWQNVVRGNH